MSFKTINPLWSLSDPLTVDQAAAMIAGVDPNSIDPSGDFFRDRETGQTDSDGITWVQAAYAGLVNAIRGKKLKVKVVHDSRQIDKADSENLFDLMECGEYLNVGYEHLAADDERYSDGYFIKNEPNWSKTLIDVQELKNWLEATPIRPEIFFPKVKDRLDTPDYLDPRHPRFAPKLAAAVRAWEAVTDPNGSHPKQALSRWLNEHAAEFGLTDANGLPIKQSIEECAKVANWKPVGGAPTTPGE